MQKLNCLIIVFVPYIALPCVCIFIYSSYNRSWLLLERRKKCVTRYHILQPCTTNTNHQAKPVASRLRTTTIINRILQTTKLQKFLKDFLYFMNHIMFVYVYMYMCACLCLLTRHFPCHSDFQSTTF